MTVNISSILLDWMYVISVKIWWYLDFDRTKVGNTFLFDLCCKTNYLLTQRWKIERHLFWKLKHMDLSIHQCLLQEPIIPLLKAGNSSLLCGQHSIVTEMVKYRCGFKLFCDPYLTPSDTCLINWGIIKSNRNAANIAAKVQFWTSAERLKRINTHLQLALSSKIENVLGNYWPEWSLRFEWLSMYLQIKLRLGVIFHRATFDNDRHLDYVVQNDR